jgi:hypothetical protein
MSNSIQFNSDGTVFSNDGTVLNKGVQNPNALSDTQKANVNIQTKVGGLTTYNTGSGMGATHRQNATQVQLRAPTGLVKVAGHEVTEAVAATLAEAAPELVTRVRSADGKNEYLTVDPRSKQRSRPRHLMQPVKRKPPERTLTGILTTRLKLPISTS